MERTRCLLTVEKKIFFFSFGFIMNIFKIKKIKRKDGVFDSTRARSKTLGKAIGSNLTFSLE